MLLFHLILAKISLHALSVPIFFVITTKAQQSLSILEKRHGLDAASHSRASPNMGDNAISRTPGFPSFIIVPSAAGKQLSRRWCGGIGRVEQWSLGEALSYKAGWSSSLSICSFFLS